MRILLQRVREARVRVEDTIVGEIGQGLLLLVGVGHGDNTPEADFLAEKCLNLRIFEDDAGKMNLSVKEIGGGILAVSQFTLYGDCKKGRRPSFTKAAPPEQANSLFEYFVEKLRQSDLHVQTGQFQAKMAVELINDGPVTFMLERES
ncbi:MAG: D-tyrosyl-tRNA(Tyr) deacylase [Gemmatimonadetes bacterium]|nr:MAG: D-tyrosyl-tRNA(Tyr) deacylase [Gemmatimonadota bacterium]